MDAKSVRIRNRKQQPRAGSSKANPLGIIMLLGLLSIPVCVSGQTTIIVRRTSDEIVLGADSLETNTRIWIDPLGQRHESPVPSSTMCKIIAVGGRAFTFAGYTGSPEMGSIDIAGIGRKALTEQSNIEKAADFFTDQLSPQVQASLDTMRRIDIVSYRKETLNEKTKETIPSL